MDYLERVANREREQLSPLRARQDKDKDLLYLKRYYVTDKDNRKVPDIIHITLNRPAVFAANVISALGRTTEQRIVETENKKLEAAYIEDFQRAGFGSANARLRRQGKPTLNVFFDEQMCIRGAGAARCLFRMDGDTLIPDITPWDTRFVTYEMGETGLEYAAYHTVRTADKIKAQYGIGITEKTAEVLDVWDTEHNEVWIDDKIVLEQPHSYGYTPVAIQVVSLGSMLADEDALEHQGESIFFLVRDVIPELNRLVSILQTLNMKAVKPPMKYKTADGAQATPPDYEDATSMGAITSVDEDIAPIDYGDAKRSAQMAYAMFDKALQEGSLSSIDLGTLQFQLSAVALIELGEGRDQVFSPRLDAKAMLNQQLAEMFTDQCIQIGGSMELGTLGHKRSFDVSKLQGEYETTYKYFAKSPKIDMARFSMAASIGRTIPERAKRVEILQREDPDEDERQLRWEEAEMLSPAIKINRTIKSLIETDDDDSLFEAELLSAEMGVNLKAMLAGEISQVPKVEEEQRPQPLPLFGGTGEPSSAKKASQLQQTPTGEEGTE